MRDDQWIVIPNWKRFQHYGDRGPVWIKLYTELNSDDKWLGLSLAERGLLATVWLEFARSSGQVRLENIRRLCSSSARGAHFEALVQAGLIELVASKPPHIALASRAPARSQEAEAEEEKREALPNRASASSNGPAETAPPPRAAKKAATANGTNLAQPTTVASDALTNYNAAARWLRSGGSNEDDWRYRIEIDFGVTDDIDLAGLVVLQHELTAQEVQA